jgi:hypothetical protein
MTILLARVVDQNGKFTEGSKGLSVFYVETHDKEGNLNNIIVHRLKDKVILNSLNS